MRSPAAPRVAGSVDEQLSNRQLYELHRFAELGRLSASLLHEISNPLTAALLHLDQFADKDSPAIRQARHNIELLRRYVESARQQVRRESSRQAFKIQPQLNQLKRLMLPLARRNGVRLFIEPAGNLQLYGDPVKFQQILANLMVNAIDAYSDDRYGMLDKAVQVRVTTSSRQVTIRVIDWGHGIASDQLAHIFEPFYSTKSQTGHGLGIGLALVKQYATEDFNAAIRVTSSRRLGTQFTIKFPRS